MSCSWSMRLIATLSVVVATSASQLHTLVQGTQSFQQQTRRLMAERRKEVLGVLQSVEEHKDQHTVVRETGGDGAEDAITQTSISEVENIITQTSSPDNSPVLASTISAIAKMKDQIKHAHSHTRNHSLKAPATAPTVLPSPAKPPIAPWEKRSVSLRAVSRPHSSEETNHILCGGRPCDEQPAANNPATAANNPATAANNPATSFMQRVETSLASSITVSTLTTIVTLLSVSVVSIVAAVAYIKYYYRPQLGEENLQDPTHSQESEHFMYEEANSPYQTSRGIHTEL